MKSLENSPQRQFKEKYLLASLDEYEEDIRIEWVCSFFYSQN